MVCSELGITSLNLAYLEGGKDASRSGYVDIAMLWQKLGGTAIVVGPGDKNMAHTSSEYVEVERIYQTQQYYKKLISKYCK